MIALKVSGAAGVLAALGLFQAPPIVPEGPAWFMALGIVAWTAVSLVKFLSQRRVEAAGGNSFAQFRVVIEPITTGLASHTAAMRVLEQTLTVVAERLNHLPTKAELLEMHRETRHDLRQPLTAQGGLLEILGDDVEELKRRTEGSEEAIRLVRESARIPPRRGRR